MCITWKWTHIIWYNDMLANEPLICCNSVLVDKKSRIPSTLTKKDTENKYYNYSGKMTRLPCKAIPLHFLILFFVRIFVVSVQIPTIYQSNVEKSNWKIYFFSLAFGNLVREKLRQYVFIYVLDAFAHSIAAVAWSALSFFSRLSSVIGFPY